jgi:hypothetical protein
LEYIGGRIEWDEEVRGGRMDGEALFYLGSSDAVDYGAEQTAGAPWRIVMKSWTIGAAARHTAGTAMMLAVAPAAGGQVEFSRNQKDRSQIAPEQDGQDEIGRGAPHR